MGAQQLMLLVLGIIIIGIAIASGIIMFNQRLIRNNRLAVINDLGIFAGVANTYYKTPIDMGGGEGVWDIDDLGMWLGYNYDAGNNSISDNNGTYVLSSHGDVLTIVGFGVEHGTNSSSNVQVTMTLAGSTGEFVTSIDN